MQPSIVLMCDMAERRCTVPATYNCARHAGDGLIYCAESEKSDSNNNVVKEKQSTRHTNTTRECKSENFCSIPFFPLSLSRFFAPSYQSPLDCLAEKDSLDSLSTHEVYVSFYIHTIDDNFEIYCNVYTHKTPIHLNHSWGFVRLPLYMEIFHTHLAICVMRAERFTCYCCLSCCLIVATCRCWWWWCLFSLPIYTYVQPILHRNIFIYSKLYAYIHQRKHAWIWPFVKFKNLYIYICVCVFALRDRNLRVFIFLFCFIASAFILFLSFSSSSTLVFDARILLFRY